MLQIIRKAIADLHLDPDNARKHDDKNLKAIKGSLKKFGQQKPIVIDKTGAVIAGNGTLEAAKALGWTEIDAVETDLKDHNARAYALADNRSSELAVWDDEVLMMTLKSLKDLDFDLESIGFDPPKESGGGLIDDDAVPEVPQNIHNVERGQIWQLGNHRLMCGDSTSKEQIEKLMNGEKADMVFTDPPYNYEPMGNSPWKAAEKNRDKIAHLSKFDPAEFLAMLNIYLGENFAAYIFSNIPLVREYLNWAVENKKNFNLLTWHKPSHIPTNSGHHYPDTEYCTFIFKKPIWNLGLAPSCYRKYWIVDSVKNGEHPTMKPVEIIENCVLLNSTKLVIDPFLGSGSTLIACEKTNRKCYGSEIDTHYCSVIIERYIKYVGSDSGVYLVDGENKTHISEVRKMREKISSEIPKQK